MDEYTVQATSEVLFTTSNDSKLRWVKLEDGTLELQEKVKYKTQDYTGKYIDGGYNWIPVPVVEK